MVRAITPVTSALVLAFAVAACAGSPVAATVPPDSASPSVVLDFYLRAYRAGDCPAARSVWVGTHQIGDGDLCGDARLDAFRIDPDPATPTVDAAEFGTTLTTSGSRDGSVRSGDVTWFFILHRQPGGAWRIVGGGSGP